VETVHVLLKLDKNSRYCTWSWIYIFYHIPLSSS